MKLPNNLGLKAYLLLFCIVSMGNLLSLVTPEGNTYTYYNILLRFHDGAMIWYVLAVLDAVLGCLTVIPLTWRAFNKTPVLIELFQLFFVLRIITLFIGHNYELIILKSAFLGTPFTGWLLLMIWGSFIFPSFKEHYIYAFRSKK